MKRPILIAVIGVFLLVTALVYRQRQVTSLPDVQQPYAEQLGESTDFSVRYPASWAPTGKLTGDEKLDPDSLNLEGTDPILGETKMFITTDPGTDLSKWISERAGDKNVGQVSKAQDWVLPSGRSAMTWTEKRLSVDAHVEYPSTRIITFNLGGQIVSAVTSDDESPGGQLRQKFLFSKILDSIELKAPKPAKK